MDGNWLQVEVMTADIPGLLEAAVDAGIGMRNVRQKDMLTLCFWIGRSNMSALRDIIQKRGGKVIKWGTANQNSMLRRIFCRPVLLFGILLLSALTVFLPTRILFVQVEGNNSLPKREILACASRCGIRIGASARGIRSERVKNSLLEELPQLQWAGVNTQGCVAVISVRERSQEEEMQSPPLISSMVAVRDGIIHSCTATKGNLVCAPGQAVKAGDVLISGYTDCGLTVRAGSSAGEVYAKTLRKLLVAVPLDWDKNEGNYKIVKKYSLIIGKKRINLYKDSGILGDTCDKMYKEYVLTIPGGFQLPVTLLQEQWVYCEDQKVSTQIRDVSDVAADTAQAYLLRQMVGGQILTSDCSQVSKNGVMLMRGEYRCLEMIGRIRSEEIIDNHGEDD